MKINRTYIFSSRIKSEQQAQNDSIDGRNTTKCHQSQSNSCANVILLMMWLVVTPPSDSQNLLLHSCTGCSQYQIPSKPHFDTEVAKFHFKCVCNNIYSVGIFAPAKTQFRSEETHINRMLALGFNTSQIFSVLLFHKFCTRK